MKFLKTAKTARGLDVPYVCGLLTVEFYARWSCFFNAIK